MGKVELNITEGFRRHGMCTSFGDTYCKYVAGYKLGVSSKIDSVEEKNLAI